MPLLSLSASIALALSATPPVTPDADDAGAWRLPRVNVEADARNAPVEAARQRLGEIAGAATVVDAERYREQRASTLADALGYAAGVFVQPRFGSEESRLSVRGSGLQRTFHLRGLELLQDGVYLNQADGGGVKLGEGRMEGGDPGLAFDRPLDQRAELPGRLDEQQHAGVVAQAVRSDAAARLGVHVHELYNGWKTPWTAANLNKAGGPQRGR